MDENSLGPQNRAVEVHLSYTQGIIDQHIEIAELAVNMGIVENPSQGTYVFEGQKWRGVDNFAEAIRIDESMAEKLLEKIKDVDNT
jgi:hypothetical protein